MPEEDDYEPDSPECQLTDTLVEALWFGKADRVAAALRELGEVDGEPLKSLALLLGDQAFDPFFPYRLEFRRTRRGKPKYQPGIDNLSTPDEKLIDALMRGDRTTARAALREMKSLRGKTLELMAQLLEDSPKLDPSFPWRLLFRRSQRGHPYHPLRTGAKSFARYVAVQHAKAALLAAEEPSRMKSAIFDAGKQTGCSRTSLFRAVKRHRPKSVEF